MMKKILYAAPAAALLLILGCNSGPTTPQELLDRYFSSAVKQDYGTTYSCYYAPYKAKISKEDFIKHRRDASVLQSYKIGSVRVTGNTAQAEALLTFAPAQKFGRKEPVVVKVKEDMVQEGKVWKIKVW